MTVERLLQLHVAVLAALGTLLLGMGQREAVLPILTIFAAATSVYFTDTLRWFVLSRTLGNIAALGAVVFSSFKFWTFSSDEQLLAIANLLVYLQIILLYQQKNSTRYWEIAVLSLLQVVVAAALSMGLEFGVLLMVYMLTAFSGLALFFIYREGLRYCAPEADDVTATAPANPRKRSLRRQLLGDPVVVSQLTPQTTFVGGLLGWDFVRNVSSLGVLTLVFTVVMFFTVPRTSNAVWQGHSESGNQTGFSPEVTLNEPGRINQSSEVVMRVTFRKPDSDKPIEIVGEPYFYGTSLTRYATDNGISRWSNPHASRPNRLRPPPAGAEVMLQETVMLASDSYLFSMPAAYLPANASDEVRRSLRLDWVSGQLTRRADRVGQNTFDYTLASTGFKGNWQLPVVQHQAPRDLLENSATLRGLTQLEKHDWLLQIDREKFPRLIAKAEEVLADAKLDKQDRVIAARLLQDHFRTPGVYNYTLDFSELKRDKQIDPIEDFIANHKTGHCEYFASALCLMLRSQGIPARVVVGFKGGEYNSVGGYYWVRQLHAHAWVEAYLEKEQIPAGAVQDALIDDAGGWLRLDATPASDEPDSFSSSFGALGRVGDAMDYMQLLWSDYILGLNSERQKASIFNPLTDRAASMLGGVLNEDLQKNLAKLGERLGMANGRFFNWQGGVAASIIAASLVVLYQLAAWAWNAITGWRRKHAQAERPMQRRVVEFYERLERLLAEVGITRAPQQTQREFASAASVQLAELGPATTELRELPAEVVDAFYRVRFGEAALDADQAQAIEHALASLSQFITTRAAQPS